MDIIAWLDSLPTWALGTIFLAVLVVVLLIRSLFGGFWTAGAHGRPATWDDVYASGCGGWGSDGGDDGCDGGGDGGGD